MVAEILEIGLWVLTGSGVVLFALLVVGTLKGGQHGE